MGRNKSVFLIGTAILSIYFQITERLESYVFSVLLKKLKTLRRHIMVFWRSKMPY